MPESKAIGDHIPYWPRWAIAVDRASLIRSTLITLRLRPCIPSLASWADRPCRIGDMIGPIKSNRFLLAGKQARNGPRSSFRWGGNGCGRSCRAGAAPLRNDAQQGGADHGTAPRPCSPAGDADVGTRRIVANCMGGQAPRCPVQAALRSPSWQFQPSRVLASTQTTSGSWRIKGPQGRAEVIQPCRPIAPGLGDSLEHRIRSDLPPSRMLMPRFSLRSEKSRA